MPYRYPLIVVFILMCSLAYGQQQDLSFTVSTQLFQGKKILKIKRDFYDPYLWVLAANNEVFRVNTQDQTWVDFTGKFTAYGNLQFIDIAGRDADTVFIATNSTNLIRYRAGVNDVIGTANGLQGTLNSIGINYSFEAPYYTKPFILFAATDQGLYRFDMNAQRIIPDANPFYSRVYEATYRRQMFADSDMSRPQGFLNSYAGSSQVLYDCYLPENDQMGYQIRTAYFTPGLMYETEGDSPLMELYWGNSKGMWQVGDVYSDSPNPPYNHFLDGIGVNKITGIYGLTAFGNGHQWGNPGLIRENLLVGTDNGFYFSTSTYDRLGANNLYPLSLFHDDDLGNVKVNDICVNATQITEPICENGIYVACDNGLYLLRPDFGKYVSLQHIAAARFKGLPDTLSRINICSGSSVTAAVNDTIYTGHTFQWYKDGTLLPGQVADTLSITATGDYYANLYDPCENLQFESNHLKVNVIAAPLFSFNYPDKLQYCDSTQTTLKTDNNPGYHYRWYTNGVLNGDTTYKSIITASGKYKVEVSACTNSWVPSKEIEVDLIDLPVPAVTADKPKYCAGDGAILTVNTPVDPTYTINWYRDGSIIDADKNKSNVTVTVDGSYSAIIQSDISPCSKTSNAQQITFTVAPVFTFNYPDEIQYCSGTSIILKADGDPAYQYRWYKDGNLTGDTGLSLSVIHTGKYKVEVSSCDGSWVPSKEVQVDIIDLPAPVISKDKPAYCIGDNATLSIAVPADPSYSIKWYKDNVLQAAYTNQTSVTTTYGGNYNVSIVSNQANTDGTICTQTSSIQTIVFKPPPTASIQKIVRTTLCDGQTVDLKVSYNTGTVNWSTGQTGDQISINRSGTYKATITSTAGCSADVSEDVQFFPNPILNIPNTAVCVPSHKSVTLTAPAGMSTYTWNGQQGSNKYVADHPQTVTLTVTNANGCQATQDIQVADECPDVKIPNAFTPNGDGINDTWDIVGLEYDQTALVRIFTRYGQQVFQSKGYGIPWNGEYQGKKLPTGAYYYIINTKNGTQTFSGEVTIIY